MNKILLKQNHFKQRRRLLITQKNVRNLPTEKEICSTFQATTEAPLSPHHWYFPSPSQQAALLPLSEKVYTFRRRYLEESLAREWGSHHRNHRRRRRHHGPRRFGRPWPERGARRRLALRRSEHGEVQWETRRSWLRNYGGAPEIHRLERRNPCCSTRHFAGVHTPDFQPSTCPLSSTDGDLQLPERLIPTSRDLSVTEKEGEGILLIFIFYFGDFKRECEVNSWDRKCLESYGLSCGYSEVEWAEDCYIMSSTDVDIEKLRRENGDWLGAVKGGKWEGESLLERIVKALLAAYLLIHPWKPYYLGSL